MHAAVADASALRTLEKLNAEYIAAVQASDTAWFEAHLAPDFLDTRPDGSLLDRRAFLQLVAKPAGISQLAAEDVRIRLFAEVAVIHGRTTYRKPDGSAGAGRYTDIYALRDGRWQVVAAQVMRS
jgi:ketosteroid isomerase-like protein